MKHLDLFAGIGGFSLALERVLGSVNGGFSEIDKYATQIYKRHFLGHIEYGDITTIRERELPDFDLITFGFPCQDLSIAGKRKGFDGHRSSLFHEAIRIINEVRPKYFIFENVKGLYSSRKGEDFITVLQTITDIGYSGQWQLLNTKWFLPQNRERIYFIGHLRGEPRPQVFPIGEDAELFSRKSWAKEGQPQAEYCATTVRNKSGKADDTYIQENVNVGLTQLGNVDTKGHNSIWGRVYDPTGIATNINSNGGGLGAKTGLYEMPTNKIRRLTPTECERLQGYPDGWTEGLSDTQRYKTLGNSITVNVAQEIFKRLYK